MKIAAHAKVNLALDVCGRRPDGYHEVRMVMQETSLCDTLTIERAAYGVTLTCSDAALPCDENNLAYRAAALFLVRAGLGGGVTVHLEKCIPSQAGLGGGSADAAAVLKGMNALFATHIPTDTLMQWGLELGADVPFCILGGTALAEGIGEKLTPLPGLARTFLVIVKPDGGISTPAAYSAVDAMQPAPHADVDAVIAALDNPTRIAACMQNAFEAVVVPQMPVIGEIKRRLLALGADGAMMTGTGSAVFGLFSDEKTAQRAYDALRPEPHRVFFAHTL